MNLSVLGGFIGTIAQVIPVIAFYFSGMVLAAVVVALILRLLSDGLRLNPFGKFSYYTTRPANRLIGNMRTSHFYNPLRRALGFDPAVLMVLLATALVCYVGYTLMGYLTTILWGLANTLVAFGGAQLFTSGRYLIGTVLIGVIFFLLSLMLMVFVNSLFGLLPKFARRAEYRIRPLLQVFEFGGMFAGWSFLILWIALSFAATAVQLIFLSDLKVV